MLLGTPQRRHGPIQARGSCRKVGLKDSFKDLFALVEGLVLPLLKVGALQVFDGTTNSRKHFHLLRNSLEDFPQLLQNSHASASVVSSDFPSSSRRLCWICCSRFSSCALAASCAPCDSSASRWCTGSDGS